MLVVVAVSIIAAASYDFAKATTCHAATEPNPAASSGGSAAAYSQRRHASGHVPLRAGALPLRTRACFPTTYYLLPAT